MRLQLARRSRHAGAAAFIDKAHETSTLNNTMNKLNSQRWRWREREGERERERDRDRDYEQIEGFKVVSRSPASGSSLVSFGIVCGARHFGVGLRWFMARGLEAVQALRSEQRRCSISATSSGFEHWLIHFNGT